MVSKNLKVFNLNNIHLFLILLIISLFDVSAENRFGHQYSTSVFFYIMDSHESTAFHNSNDRSGNCSFDTLVNAEIRALIDKAAASVELAEDEYIDPSDGLMNVAAMCEIAGVMFINS